MNMAYAIYELVHDSSNSSIFGCVKAPWLRDRERHCIKSIQCLYRSLNHGSFHASQKPSYLMNRELKADHSLSVTSSALKREGALLKITFDSGLIGYADCHPWPELGDLPLKEQLAHWAQGKLTLLTRCALEFASIDSQYRAQGKSVFSHQNIPHSHFLVTNIFDWTPHHVQQVIQQGYSHIKLKVGRHIDREVASMHSLFLNTSLKLRLDFNETLTPAVFRSFLQRIQQLQDHLDFIEDPFPFDSQEWTAIQKEGWILACDREAQMACYQPEAARILIVKPALHSFQEWQKWTCQTRIVTSYLGHPLGQVAAAYVASQVDPSCALVHGLLSHHAYQSTSFSQRLNWQNPCFVLPPGTGFGFDQELEQLEWFPMNPSHHFNGLDSSSFPV